MPTWKSGTWRLLAVVAVAALGVGSLASSVVLASTQGRNQAQCVQACNVIRDACVNQCVVDCSGMYPPGPAYDACYNSCYNVCQSDKQECKAKCNVNRTPPSPTEP